ncbi:MAG: hypothetical protein ABUK08_07375, partial [Candidatus Humimicrobiaceae bacterium]
VMPNPAVAVLFSPIAYNTAINLGMSPYPFFMTIAVSASAAFLSPVGVSVDKGISTATDLDAELMRSIIDCSKKTILICDSTKFGKYSYINVAPLTTFTEIITDKALDKDYYNKIKDNGIKITLV